MREALLKAVVDSPDDDAPRLIFADWLEESGDLDRAEFIRLQCSLATLPTSDPRVPEMRQREAGLLSKRSWEWAAADFGWDVIEEEAHNQKEAHNQTPTFLAVQNSKSYRPQEAETWV